MMSNFDMFPHCNSKYSSANPNMLARIQNSVANAINKNKHLPSFLVIILDDDIITYTDYMNLGVSEIFGKLLGWLVKEIDQLITTRKKQLLEKSKCEDELFIYWSIAPTHYYFAKECNELRAKFNLVLQSVVHQYDNMRVIKMKDYWKADNPNLVNKVNGKITDEGMHAYWKAVDAAFKFNYHKREHFLAKKKVALISGDGTSTSSDLSVGKPQKKDDIQRFFDRRRQQDHQDRFHWHNDYVREDRRPRFLLPRAR